MSRGVCWMLLCGCALLVWLEGPPALRVVEAGLRPAPEARSAAALAQSAAPVSNAQRFVRDVTRRTGSAAVVSPAAAAVTLCAVGARLCVQLAPAGSAAVADLGRREIPGPLGARQERGPGLAALVTPREGSRPSTVSIRNRNAWR